MLYRFRGPNPTPYHQQLNLMRTPALNLQTSTTIFPYPPPLQTKLLIIFIALTFESYGGAGVTPGDSTVDFVPSFELDTF